MKGAIKWINILIILITLLCLSTLFGCSQNNYNKSEDSSADSEDTDKEIDSGTMSASVGYERTFSLDSKNGKYVYFYIENIGNIENTCIAAEINDSSSHTFNPGDKGYIYTEVVNNLFDKPKDYEFKAVTGKNGGKAEMTFKIVQTDRQIS